MTPMAHLRLQKLSHDDTIQPMTAPPFDGLASPAFGTRRQRLAVAVMALAAFALRLMHLGQQSLWYDETVSVYLAGQPAAALIAHTARDIHPPLYYLLLRGWLLLAGYPTGQADPTGHGLEFMAAFLSLCFGVLLVPLTWQLARRLGLASLSAGLAALLIALSPFGVWYSQEVRMYTLGACLGVIVLLAALPFLRRTASPGRLRRAALLYALAAAAGLATLYYFAFLLISLNLLVLAALAMLARSGDRPEQGGAELARSGDRPEQSGAELARSGDRPEQGGAMLARSGDRPEQGEAELARSGDRPEQGGAELARSGDRPEQGGAGRARSGDRPEQGGAGLARSGDRPEQGGAGRAVGASRGQMLLLWLAAQAGALLLFLPWLPTAWRQVTDPPVPPWRVAPQLLAALLESWSALILGQAASLAQFWPLLLLALALVILGILAARRSPIPHSPFAIHQSTILLAAALGPLLLILLASLWTPLYHVRYLFTFSPPWSVLLAMGLAALWRWNTRLSRALALTSLILLVAGSAVALRSFWSDPAHAADDHRAAVRQLAQRWRPGDVILANAGYAYTALLTYWPGPVAWHGRLTDYTPAVAERTANEQGAVILQTGHIDGEAGLGWGDANSDFYALPAEAMRRALANLAGQTDRLWHYRIYDTVNDPQGAIRAALEGGWTLFDDRVYSGEANLRVQGWQGMRQASSSELAPAAATFGGWLELRLPSGAAPSQVEAGGALDLPDALWRRDPAQPGQPAALSLRLVDAEGAVWAAADEPLGGNVLDLTTASELVQPLRLAIPPGTAPGPYELVLVVYDPQTGQPLSAASAAGEVSSQAPLGQVEVVRPAQPPAAPRAVADFGPLRLVEAATPAAAISPGDAIPVELLWQAAPDFAAEPLVVVVQLLDSAGGVAASLEAEPLAGRYPTTQWQPGELVRDRQVLTAPASLAPGRYQLIVGLYRAADGQRLMTDGGLFGLAEQGFYEVEAIDVR